MSRGTYEDFRQALLRFESGWDKGRYQSGNIVDAQLDQWAGGPVTNFFPNYRSWGEMTDAEWATMAYRSTNSLGFVGYQFGEALLIDLGYYDDTVFFGAGAATNTWDGQWTGKNGIDSFDEFKTGAAQETAIQEAFGYNLKIIQDGLAASGRSLADFIGTTMSIRDGGQMVNVELTLTGILAAAHLRGAWGLLNLLQNGVVSSDEFGTSILQYVKQFGDYDAPSIADAIAFFDTRKTGDEGLGGPAGGGTGTGGDGAGTGGAPGQPGNDGGAAGLGTAGVDASTADVVITWNWGANEVVDFNPASDTVFVDWLNSDALDVSETAEGVVFSVPSNSQTITLKGVKLADLSPANFTFRDASAAQEVLTLVGRGAPAVDPGESGGNTDHGGHGGTPGTGGHDHGGGQTDGGNTGGDAARMFEVSLTSTSRTVDDFDLSKDMVHIEPGVTAARLQIFEESGDALGQTVRIAVLGTNGVVQSTLILKDVGLSDLSMKHFSISDQTALNEVTAAIGATIEPTPTSGGFDFSRDTDGSSPPKTTGETADGGTKFLADTNADDIVGFVAGRDQLDFGNTSVHGIIVTKSAAGEVVVDYPWAAAQQIVQGISFQDMGIKGFGVVGNEHLRQDIGGVVSWELGVGPRESDTVYVRSHEYGKQETVSDFDPATMKLSFLYFGTREQLSVRDTSAGLVISSLPTGQSLTLTGVKLADLAPGRVEFHHDQVMEDNLETAFGFRQDDVTLVSRADLLTPDAPAGQTTDGLQTRPGKMAPDSSVQAQPATGDENGGGHDHSAHDHGNGAVTPANPVVTPVSPVNPGAPAADADRVAIGWNWGVRETIAGFDAASDVLDFGTLNAQQIAVSESNGDLLIEVLDNGGHIYQFENLQAEDLSLANLDAADFNPVVSAPGGVADQLAKLGAADWHLA